MKWLLVVAALTAAPVLGATFDDCGVTFSYPDHWFAKAGLREHLFLWEYDNKEVRCAIGLRPPGGFETTTDRQWTSEIGR